MLETFIIIPCYNEENRLDTHKFKSYLDNNSDIFFLFVNDGSTDNTKQLINGMQDAYPQRIMHLSLTKNFGKAEAVRCGVLKSIELGARNIGYWDADLSTPLFFIKKMLDKLDDQVTLILGSRVMLLGYQIERLPIRHYSGRIFATFASIILDLPVYDTQCGAKLFRNNFEIQKAFSLSFSVNWSFDIELLGRLKIIKNYFSLKPLTETAIEQPLEKWVHCPGSKIKAFDFFIAIKELITLKKNFCSPVYRKRLLMV
jgi:glycosyltransferase involved in cell wall biosynthesis